MQYPTLLKVEQDLELAARQTDKLQDAGRQTDRNKHAHKQRLTKQ